MLWRNLSLFYIIGISLLLAIPIINAAARIDWGSRTSATQRRFLRRKDQQLFQITHFNNQREHKLQTDSSSTTEPLEKPTVENQEETLEVLSNTTILDQSHPNNNTLSPSEKEFIEEFMEKEEEIIKEKEEIVAEEVGGISILLGIVFMIFTAYQMSENPDGVCASLCRLTFTLAGCVVKMMLWPFKKMCGHRFSGYAHHLVATHDYGETTMGLFQIS